MNENKGFISWIRKYPTKFMILIFLVFIPLILIFTALITVMMLLKKDKEKTLWKR